MCLTPRIDLGGISSPLISTIRLPIFFAKTPMRSSSLSLRKIADALELISNPQDPNDLPKVHGYRLTPYNGFTRPFLNVVLHDIDCRVRSNYPPRATAVARRQHLDRFRNLLLGKPAHLRDCPREFLQVRVENSRCMSSKGHFDGLDPPDALDSFCDAGEDGT